jgi:hypothetical protein
VKASRLLAAASCVLALAATVGQARADDGIPIDMGPENECLGFVPHLATEATRSTIPVDVVVAYDGISLRTARRIMAEAAKPYAPGLVGQLSPDVKLNYIAFHDVTGVLTSSEVTGFVVAERPSGNDLMSSLIRYYRTHYPRLRRHHVHLLTSKDVWAEVAEGQRTNAVAGIANCIGSIGTKYSYSITEVGHVKPATAGPLTFYENVDAKAAAHEMGHSFGAHHHYAVCGPSAPGSLVAGRGDFCSLMTPFADLTSMEFGPVEVAAIRGYTEAHIKH